MGCIQETLSSDIDFRETVCMSRVNHFDDVSNRLDSDGYAVPRGRINSLLLKAARLVERNRVACSR